MQHWMGPASSDGRASASQFSNPLSIWPAVKNFLLRRYNKRCVTSNFFDNSGKWNAIYWKNE